MRKNKTVAMLLCCGAFVGIGGLHDFYLKRYGWGIAKLLTCDFLWLGAFYDLFKMYKNDYDYSLNSIAKNENLDSDISEAIASGSPLFSQKIEWETGSDNQVAWAEKIVQNAVKRLNNDISKAFENELITEAEGTELARVIEKAVLSEDDANWWIDNRTLNNEELLNELLEGYPEAISIVKKMY